MRNRVPRDRPTVSASEASATFQPGPTRLFEARPFAKLVQNDDSLAASLSAPASAVPLVSVSSSTITSSQQTLPVAPKLGFRDRLLSSHLASLDDRAGSAGSASLVKRSGLLLIRSEDEPPMSNRLTNATNNHPNLLLASSNNSSNVNGNHSIVIHFLNASSLADAQTDQKLSPGSVTVTSLPAQPNNSSSASVSFSSSSSSSSSSSFSSSSMTKKTDERQQISSQTFQPNRLTSGQLKTMEVSSDDDKTDSASELHPAFLPYFDSHLPPINEFTDE